MQRRIPLALRRSIGVTAALALAAGLAACSTDPGTGGAETVEIKVNLTHSTTSDIYVTMQEVAERIQERTDGRVTVGIFPDSQLGSN